MKFRPPHDRVLVKRIDAQEKSVSAVIIPETAEQKLHAWIVQLILGLTLAITWLVTR
ncbi:Chaperonin subunit [Bradyrhizobium sp. Rc3b]|nr:Chaperonin subunit [Bradyrhizobium sp. Rc3b]